LATGADSSSSDEESESEEESESALATVGLAAVSVDLGVSSFLYYKAVIAYAFELPASHADSNTPAVAIFALVSPSNALTDRVRPRATR
jgi:hypothetical protein